MIEIPVVSNQCFQVFEGEDTQLLCDDLWLKIFRHLPSVDLAKCSLVCRNWYHISAYDALWLPFYSEFGGCAEGRLPIKFAYARCQTDKSWKLCKTRFKTQKVDAFVRRGPLLVCGLGGDTLSWDSDHYSKNVSGPLVEKVGKITQFIFFNRCLVFAGWSSKLQVWDTETKRHVHSFIDLTDWVSKICLNDTTLVGVSDNGEVCLWDLFTLQCVKTLKLPNENICAMTVIDNFIMTASQSETTIRVTDLETKETKTLQPPDKEEVIFLTHFKNALISVHDEGVIHLWNKAYNEIDMSAKASKPITSANVCGNLLVTGHFDGTVRLWKLPSLQISGTVKASDFSITNAAREGEELTVVDSKGHLSFFESCPLTPDQPL